MNHGVQCGPTMFTKTGIWPRWTAWIPRRGRRGGTGRANSKRDLVTGPIPFRGRARPMVPASPQGAPLFSWVSNLEGYQLGYQSDEVADLNARDRNVRVRGSRPENKCFQLWPS